MSNETLKKTIAMLLTAWPSSTDDGMSIGGTIRVYEFALEGIREQYIEQAVKAFLQGRVPDHNREFRPKPARLAEYARSLQASDDRIREIEERVKNQTKQVEYQGPSDEERRAGIEKWKRAKAEMAELDPVKAYSGKKALQSWDKNPHRWTDRDELKASAKRLQARGFMDDPDKTAEENESARREKQPFYANTEK